MKRPLLPNRRDSTLFLAASILCVCAFSLADSPFGAKAQNEKAKPQAMATARPDDVKSMDAILAALYDVISGPAGKRDWDRLRSLFHPNARMIPCAGRRRKRPSLRSRLACRLLKSTSRGPSQYSSPTVSSRARSLVASIVSAPWRMSLVLTNRATLPRIPSRSREESTASSSSSMANGGGS